MITAEILRQNGHLPPAWPDPETQPAMATVMARLLCSYGEQTLLSGWVSEREAADLVYWLSLPPQEMWREMPAEELNRKAKKEAIAAGLLK